MTFARSEYLFLIWLVPVFIVVCSWGMRVRRRILRSYCTKEDIFELAPVASVKKRWILNIMLLFSVLFIVLALSGPLYGYKWQKVERKGTDFFIVFDCSKSMLADDIKPSRIEWAKRKVKDLLSMLEGDRAGLVAFAGTSFIQCPLTLDYQAFHIFLEALGPDYIPVGGTDINRAILEALSGFSESDNTDKAIVLITDGENTVDEVKDAVLEAKKRGVRVYCIGIGTEEGVPVPDQFGGFVKDRHGKIVLTRMDESVLSYIASETGGIYVRSAVGDMDLDRIYKKGIRKDLDLKTVSSDRQKISEDRFQWFLFPALILMLGSMVFYPGERTWKNRKKGGLKTGAGTFVIILCFFLFPLKDAYGESLYSLGKKGQEYFKSGEYDKALDVYTKAQLESPDKPEISYNLGNVQYKKGNYDEALEHYRAALKSSDKKLEQKTRFNMGNAFFRTGDYDKAIEEYEKAVEIDKNDNDAKKNLEFAKHVKDNKNKPPDDKKDSDSDKDKKDEDNSGASGKKNDDGKGPEKEDNRNKGDDQKQGDKPEENNKENDRDNGDDDKQGKDGHNDQKDRQDQEQDDRNGAAGRSEETQEREQIGGNNQDDMILNRLKDQPGKALLMDRKPRKVEKDW